MKLTATLTFNYEIPDEDWAIQYDDDDIGVQAENSFLQEMIGNIYGGQVEITSLELGVVTQQPLDTEENAE